MNEINWRALESGVKLLHNSATLSRSEINQRLLMYLFDEMSAGRGTAINEYTIAQDVFDRGNDFDPAKDPIVRVRMRRLRNAINAHNATLNAGAARVDLPIGQYQLHCVEAANPEGLNPGPPSPNTSAPVAASPPIPAQSDAKPAPRTYLHRAALIVLSLVIAAVLLNIIASPRDVLPDPDRPVIYVERFRNLTGDPAHDAQEFHLKQQIAIDLDRFQLIDVTLLAEDRTPSFILQGHIIAIGNEADIVVRLLEAPQRRRIYERRIQQPIGAAPLQEVLSEMIAVFSRDVAGLGGAVLNSQHALVIDDDLRCLALTNRFLTAPTTEGFDTAHACLSAQTDRRTRDPRLGAAFGMLKLYAVTGLATLDNRNLSGGQLWSEDKLQHYAQELAIAHPGHAQVQSLLGHVLMSSNDPVGASAAYQRAQQINPASDLNNSLHCMTLYGKLAPQGDAARDDMRACDWTSIAQITP